MPDFGILEGLALFGALDAGAGAAGAGVGAGLLGAGEAAGAGAIGALGAAEAGGAGAIGAGAIGAGESALAGAGLTGALEATGPLAGFSTGALGAGEAAVGGTALGGAGLGALGAGEALGGGGLLGAVSPEAVAAAAPWEIAPTGSAIPSGVGAASFSPSATGIPGALLGGGAADPTAAAALTGGNDAFFGGGAAVAPNGGLSGGGLTGEFAGNVSGTSTLGLSQPTAGAGGIPAVLPADVPGTGISGLTPTELINTGGTSPLSGINSALGYQTPVTGLELPGSASSYAGGAAPAGVPAGAPGGVGIEYTGPGVQLTNAGDAVGPGGFQSGGGGDVWSKLTSAISNDPLKSAGVGLGAAGLAFNLSKLGQGAPYEKQLKDQAGALAAQGDMMRQYLQNGTLPPGLKESVSAATAASKARIIQGYASRGQVADPKKNSALAQELNNADTQAAISTAQIGQTLLQTGITETQMSNSIYQALSRIDTAQSALVGNAINSFAAALAGGPYQRPRAA